MMAQKMMCAGCGMKVIIITMSFCYIKVQLKFRFKMIYFTGWGKISQILQILQLPGQVLLHIKVESSNLIWVLIKVFLHWVSWKPGSYNTCKVNDYIDVSEFAEEIETTSVSWNRLSFVWQGDLPLGLQEVSGLQFLPRYSSLNG